ncbi:MAG: hypothetical protein M3Y49_15710 [Actinomycetota bacterium]|nr:hypothetical protein [Actinomycetota bacterium]
MTAAWKLADPEQDGLELEQIRASMWFVSPGRQTAGAAAFAAWLKQVKACSSAPPVSAAPAVAIAHQRSGSDL